MRKPHVAQSRTYQAEGRVPTTHTISINDERDECGSVTTWAFPQGFPQSMGMAIVAQVDSPNDEQDGMPAASIHACHREALKVYLANGKLLIDLKGHGLILNESSGLYELVL